MTMPINFPLSCYKLKIISMDTAKYKAISKGLMADPPTT